MRFHIGQKVVCVDADGGNAPDLLKKGSVYTISWISPPGLFRLPAVWLSELPVRRECGGFFAYRFRPVIERKTDISVFTAMLKSSKVQA